MIAPDKLIIPYYNPISAKGGRRRHKTRRNKRSRRHRKTRRSYN